MTRSLRAHTLISNIERDKGEEPRPGVLALTRRTFVKTCAAVLGGVGFAQLSVGQASAAKKSKQKQVRYQTKPKGGRACADCTFFLAEEKVCKIVEGEIVAEGWCVRWVKKKA